MEGSRGLKMNWSTWSYVYLPFLGYQECMQISVERNTVKVSSTLLVAQECENPKLGHDHGPTH